MIFFYGLLLKNIKLEIKKKYVIKIIAYNKNQVLFHMLNQFWTVK